MDSGETHSEEIMVQYRLEGLVHNWNVLVEIRKGMYGLVQAGRIANNHPVAHLKTYGYHQSSTTPGLFSHATRAISFCLVVDDFGITYVNREDARHLLASLSTYYTPSP